MKPGSTRKIIIVAEDDNWTRELISTRLDLAGYHAIEARNGVEALEHIRTASPAALVLDLRMPQLDGFEVMRALQKRKYRLPVLVMSARKTIDDIHKAIGLGADAYLTKPFDDKLFLDRVARIINRPRASGDVCFI